jgi:hypothetical protein
VIAILAFFQRSSERWESQQIFVLDTSVQLRRIKMHPSKHRTSTVRIKTKRVRVSERSVKSAFTIPVMSGECPALSGRHGVSMQMPNCTSFIFFFGKNDIFSEAAAVWHLHMISEQS